MRYIFMFLPIKNNFKIFPIISQSQKMIFRNIRDISIVYDKINLMHNNIKLNIHILSK
jgi:hypothetical protein